MSRRTGLFWDAVQMFWGAVAGRQPIPPIRRAAASLGWMPAVGSLCWPPSAAESEHELVVLSRHRTSEGVVTYARCDCGELQIWRTGAGRPTHTLITSTPGPERPPT